MKKLVIFLLLLAASLDLTAQDFTWIIYEAEDPESEWFDYTTSDSLDAALTWVVDSPKRDIKPMWDLYVEYCNQPALSTVDYTSALQWDGEYWVMAPPDVPAWNGCREAPSFDGFINWLSKRL